MVIRWDINPPVADSTNPSVSPFCLNNSPISYSMSDHIRYTTLNIITTGKTLFLIKSKLAATFAAPVTMPMWPGSKYSISSPDSASIDFFKCVAVTAGQVDPAGVHLKQYIAADQRFKLAGDKSKRIPASAPALKSAPVRLRPC